MTPIEIRHLHLFCGLGGGAKGFNRGEARVGQLQARFRCIGGIDRGASARPLPAACWTAARTTSGRS